MTKTMGTYTVKRLEGRHINKLNSRFIFDCAEKVNLAYGNKFDWQDFPLRRFADQHYLIMCYRGFRPVGFLMATLYPSFFDPKVKILYQNLLYSLPNTRSSLLLLKEFIDFGKTNANHTISVIGQNSNIKPRSLERLGFTKLEEVYRMEST